jgi:hypothetical protein
MSDNSARWLVGANSAAETGSDAGTNYQLLAYDDSGTYIDTPIEVERKSGGTIWLNRPVQNTGGTPDIGDASNPFGSVHPQAIEFDPVAANPGDSETLWVNSSDSNKLYYGSSEVGGSGDITGPGSSTDHAIPRWDGTGGNTLQNSGITISDSDTIAGIANATFASGSPLIKVANATSFLDIAGGNASGNGASVVLYGGSHSSQANVGGLKSGATAVATWDSDGVELQGGMDLLFAGSSNIGAGAKPAGTVFAKKLDLDFTAGGEAILQECGGVGTEDGWIEVNTHIGVRYIRLYSTK